MKIRALLALWLCLGTAYAEPRTSADYRQDVESLSDGGRSSSPGNDVTNDGNFSGIVESSTGTTVTNKAGFAGQLFDVQSVVVSAPANPATVIGASDVRLEATAKLDDGTSFVAQAGDVLWSFTGAGLAGVSVDGVATAAAVSADTMATVMASIAGVSGMLNVTALVPTVDRLAAIAQKNQVEPGSFAAPGELQVILLDTAGSAPRWRLAGEMQWHSSGETVADLTAGFYTVEFESIVDRSTTPARLLAAPPAASTEVEVGKLVTRTYHYPALAAGTLEVDLFPSRVTGADGTISDQEKARWRLAGETAWRDGGSVVSGLPGGTYLVEFTRVPGYQPIQTQAIAVPANESTAARVTYLLTEAFAGTLPQALSLPVATTRSPYEFVGQVSSSVGTGSGTVVAARVVLTAAHALFDDLTLTNATDVQWKGRRRPGQLEPEALIPRGFYLVDGYAAAREGKVPGQGDPVSEEFDAGVIYFDVDAGDGGSSGYLVSNDDKDWLRETRAMTLVGYPLDTSHPEVVPGQLQATPEQLVRFAPQTGGGLDVYTTHDIAGLAGMSGGPLCIMADDGRFYPAGLYLGGAGECIVRRINKEVQDLIEFGARSSQGGPNHTNGGVSLVSSTLNGSSLSRSSLTVLLDPGLPSGGSWRLSSEPSSVRRTGARVSVPASKGTVIFAPVPGFVAPTYPYELKSHESRTIRASYTPLIATIAPTPLKIGAPTLPYDDKISAANAPTSFTGTLIDPSGVPYSTQTPDQNPLRLVLDNFGNLRSVSAPDGSGVANTIPIDAPLGTYRLRVTARNRFTGLSPALVPGSRTFLLVITAARTITVNFNAEGATRGDLYFGQVKLPANPVLPRLPQGTVVKLHAEPKSTKSVFTGWSGTGAKGVPTLGRVLQFTVGSTDVNLTASFNDNILGNNAGTYQGLLSAGIDAFSGRGLLTATVSPRGVCTVSVRVGAKAYASFSETFKEVDFVSKKATLVHPIIGKHGVGNVTVALTLDASNPNAPLLAGSVVLNQVLYTSSAPRAIARRAAAKYAVVFPHANALGLPGGDGFGTFSVNTSGIASFTGTLGDSSPVSASAHLGPNGEWPVFALLYGKTNRGGLTGLLTIGGTGTIGQSLEWYKPADSAIYYPNGFALSQGRQPPLAVNGRLLPMKPFASLPSTSATVTIAGGGLAPPPAPFAVMFDRLGNAIKMDAASGPSLFSLKVNLASGLYSGRFKDSQGVIRLFSGIVLPAHDQSAAEGFGVFKGATGQTGAVEFAHP